MNTPLNSDPLALASEQPDINALIEECTFAIQQGPARRDYIAAAENVQLNRRAGKSSPPDGKRWQRNAPDKKIVKPYDGCPDSDVNLADELVLTETDIYVTAAEQAQPSTRTTHITKLNAKQAAELKAVALWCAMVCEDTMRDDLELAAALTAKLGWCVLNPGWRERWELVERELDLESFINRIVQTFGPEQAQQLYTSILDPTLEDGAVTAIGNLFSYVPRAKLKTIVRELRETRQTMFLDKELAEKGPTLRTLIQGYNYFVSGGAGRLKDCRLHLVIERFSQAQFMALAAERGYSDAYTEACLATAGQFSSEGEALRDKHQDSELEARDRSIEQWTTCVFQFDDSIMAGGWYYTTFSPHVKPGSAPASGARADAASDAFYGEHFLLKYACGAPFIEVRRMVEGPALDDSRGIPEMVRSDQAIEKMLQDALIARAHLETDPPRAFIGLGWSKIEGWNTPGAKTENSVGLGADIKELGPARGNPQVCETAIERIDAGTRRRFAFPNQTDGSHPSAWQLRQARLVKRFLGALADARMQQVILCYQELSTEELAEIIGHWPELTLSDVLKHRLTLKYDVRGLDTDWTKAVLDFVIQLLGIDKGGQMDTGLIIQLALSFIDSTIVGEVVRDPAGASAALYRKVEGDVNTIMLGNPPPMVEMDASAGMQLKMAMQIIGQNEDYQRLLQSDEKKREALKTYVQNLQHSQQETEISPTQGRLGVAAMPQRPVQRGAAA